MSFLIKFILKRLAMMIPVLIGVSFIIFAMMYFTPGDPAQVILGDMATEEDLELFRAENGLNGGFLEPPNSRLQANCLTAFRLPLSWPESVLSFR